MHALHRTHPESLQALADFVLGLVQVYVDRNLQLVGVGDDLLEAAVANRVRRMRRHAERQQRLVPKCVARGQPLVQIVLGVGRVRGRELDADDAERRPHSCRECGAPGLLGEEIHIVEAGHSAPDHLGARQQRPLEHELLGHVLGFGRPDVLSEPLHQRQIVGQAAHQRHGRMRVQIDQARDQCVRGELGVRAGDIGAAGLLGWHHRDDAPVAHYHCMVLEEQAGRLHRDHIARADDAVGRCGLGRGFA